DGLMADWLLLGLGLLAAFVLRFKDRFERLILLWIGIPSIPFLVLDSYDQTRIVYDLPIPILTAVATVRFLPRMATRWNRSSELVILLLILVVACYALQGVLLL